MKYREEIDALYREIYPALYGYAHSALGSVSLAEEAVQEAFVIACQKEEVLISCKNPGGWVYKVLQNVIGNIRREQNIHRRIIGEYLTDHTGSVVSAEDGVKLDLLYEDIAELDAYILLKDYVVEKKSYLELAQERGVSLATCRKMVQRAKQRLKKYFE